MSDSCEMYPTKVPINSEDPLYRPKDRWDAHWNCDGAADTNAFWIGLSGSCEEYGSEVRGCWEDIVDKKYLCTIPGCLAPGVRTVSFKADKLALTIEMSISVELPDEPPEDEFDMLPRRAIKIHEVTLKYVRSHVRQ